MAKKCADSTCGREAFRDGDYCQPCEFTLRAEALTGIAELAKWLAPRLSFCDWRHDHGIED